MGEQNNYYWIRIFDYVFERNLHEKGTMLDEFYLKDVAGGREQVKQLVKERYCSNTANDLKFAKPKKRDGIYAVIMESNKFFYDRFCVEVNTVCFWCHNHIQGRASEFPRDYIGDKDWYEPTDDEFSDLEKTAYFCSYDHKAQFRNSLCKDSEGEFQMKEEGKNGNTFGYVYLIYNRSENVYYIGQTRYMPFFRWQEHVKDGGKGDISDLSFSVLAEVGRNQSVSEEQNRLYLNSVEAWWIAKFEHEGHKVFNISKPRITLQHLKDLFNHMVLKQETMKLT